MADSNLVTLPAASALGGTEVVYGVQSATDVKITIAQIATYAKNNSAGGTSQQLQFNNGANGFSGAGGTTWDDGNRALTIAGTTVTTSKPILNLSQTWNAGAVTFSGVVLNITDTASAAASLFLDFQIAAASKFSVSKAGLVRMYSNILFNTDGVGNIGAFGATRPDNIFAKTQINCGGNIFCSSNLLMGPASDAIIGRGQSTAGYIQLGGATDSASPVAQQLGPVSVVAGTSNTAGADFTINGSRGTGTGAGGQIIFRTSPAGSTGSAQNAPVTAMTIKTDQGVTFANYVKTNSTTVASLPAAATAGAGARLFVTDATVTTYNSTVAGGGANKVPVVSDGTNWLIG